MSTHLFDKVDNNPETLQLWGGDDFRVRPAD
jgi:hypothetical protein